MSRVTSVCFTRGVFQNCSRLSSLAKLFQFRVGRQQGRQFLPRVGEIREALEDDVVLSDGTSESALAGQSLGQTVMSPDLHRARASIRWLKFRLGCGKLTVFQQGEPQIVVRFRIVIIQLHQSFVLRDAFVRPARRG